MLLSVKIRLMYRFYYLDVLRIMATIAVVMIHVTGMRWLQIDIYSIDWDVYNVCRAISRWAVPMFVLISGSLFLNSKTLNVKKIYGKNLVRILVSFIFWYIIFAIFQTRGYISEVLQHPLHYIGHLWFLILIGALYVLLPLIRKIYEGGGKKALLLFIILAFLFPSCLETIPFLLGVDVIQPQEMFYLKIVQKVLGWISYFMLGGYLGNLEVSGKKSLCLIPLFILLVLSSILVYKWYVLTNGHMVDEFYDNISITVLFEVICLFLIIKGIVPKTLRSKFSSEHIIVISGLTFGVYLTHMLFLPVITSFCETRCLSSISLILISMVFTMALSMLLSSILNKVRIFKQFIV